MTSAGTLSDPMREVIERVFRAPVFNRYGSREVGIIAAECEHHCGLHVIPGVQHVEVLRPDGTQAGPGEIGEVVITPLRNFAMPLIRYRIGDTALWANKSCSCGRGWPLLETVTGRVTDSFVTRDGSLVHGGYFRLLFFSEDWVGKYQIIQESVDRISISVVLDTASDAMTQYERRCRNIEEDIHVVMGKCTVDWDIVPDIAPLDSGKYRYVMSKVTKDSDFGIHR